MIDIDFYMESFELTQKLMKGEPFDKEYIFNKFEKYRKKKPVVYNIETTNACNMKCKMCPRTTRMTRKIETINREVFINILNQLRPWSKEERSDWERVVKKKHKKEKDEQ